MNRLIVTFSRVTARDKHGNPTRHVRESVNLVHPDDHRGKQHGFNAFRELGAMFRGNPDYFDIDYQKKEVAA